MPVVHPLSSLLTLIERANIANSSLPSQAVDGTDSHAVKVVCAWPVSGQYGPGSRILYYVLVAACVLARRQPWLRDACLAAALLFPAVAAIHGIVLAAMHVDHAVDLDIYGAFQLCAIGILTAPPTVRLSKTYWSQVQGRNVIFIWITLILAGLLSLTIEFYRTDPSICQGLAPGAPFPWGEDNACGLTCSVNDGPFSPTRQGSANNIYVIPSPKRITFGMGTLFAAACCVPAVLSMLSIWNKIISDKRKKRLRLLRIGMDQSEVMEREVIDRTNKLIQGLLSVVEIPVFAGAVLALVILGEMNFWSTQVYYMTERIAAVGQWAPIAGTGLAVVGALALRLMEKLQEEPIDEKTSSSSSSYGAGQRRPTIEFHAPPEDNFVQSPAVYVGNDAIVDEPASIPATPSSPEPVHMDGDRDHGEIAIHSSSDFDPDERLQHTQTFASSSTSASRSKDAGRKKFASIVSKVTRNPALDRDEQLFAIAKKALPELPGEENRNPLLREQKERFGRHRSSFGPSNAPSIYEDSDPGIPSDGPPIPYTEAPPRRHMTLPTTPLRSYPPPRSKSGSLSRPAFDAGEGRSVLGQHSRTTSEPYGTGATSSLPGSPALGRSNTLEVPQESHGKGSA